MPPESKDALGTPLDLQEIGAAQAPSVVDMAALKRQSVRGGAMTIGTQAISIAIQLTSTVILSRLLSPDDYGVLAMVMAITGVAGLFSQLGLSIAAVQKRGLTHALQTNLFWMNAAVGGLLTTIVAAASPLVAAFYHKPELTRVTAILATSFLFGSLSTQHGAMLVREMRFGRKAIASITASILGLVLTTVLAALGYGYWALVWGGLATTISGSMLLFILSPFLPGLPSKGTGVRNMLRFGANITAFDLINYCHRNLDNILIGKVWGADALGLYARAYSLLMLPIDSVRGPIAAVAFPALSKLQNEPVAFRSYYLKTTSLIALLSMPLSAFCFVSSRSIIEMTLGKHWLGASPIFSYLTLAAFIQPASGFAGSLLLSLGQGRRYFWCGLFNAIILSVCFVIGVRWGAIGVALGYSIGNYVVLYPWLWWAFRESPVSFEDVVRACAYPAAISFLGAGASMCANMLVAKLHPVAQVSLLAAAFIVATAPVFCLTRVGRMHLQLFRTLWDQFRQKAPQAT